MGKSTPLTEETGLRIAKALEKQGQLSNDVARLSGLVDKLLGVVDDLTSVTTTSQELNEFRKLKDKIIRGDDKSRSQLDRIRNKFLRNQQNDTKHSSQENSKASA